MKHAFDSAAVTSMLGSLTFERSNHPADIEPPLVKASDCAAKADAGRLAALDGVRALAAIAVIASHVFIQLKNPGQAPGIVPFGDPSWGSTAVLVFFVLSGFLLFLRMARSRFDFNLGDLTGYLMGRLFRMLPLYFMALATYAVLMPSSFLAPDTAGTWFLRHVLFIEADAHFWTIKQEIMFYLVLPVFAVACGFIRHKGLVALFLGGCIMLAYYLCNLQNYAMVWGNDAWIVFYIAPFLIGMLLAVIADSVPRTWGRELLILGCIGLCIFARTPSPIHSLSDFMGLRFVSDWSPLFWGLAALVVMGAYLDRDGLFGNRLLQKIGEAGYGVYIWHLLVLHSVHGATGYDGWRALLLTIFFSIVLALVTFRFVERPAMQCGRNLSRRLRMRLTSAVPV